MARDPLTTQRIGVIMGGRSAEREISLRTGRTVFQALQRRGYDVVAIDARASVYEQLRANKVGLVFIALHGPVGEDGSIQGMLEVMGLPYTGSGIRASAIAMHKPTAKALLEAQDIPVPPGHVIRIDDAEGLRRRTLPAGLRWPVVVKPATQGSTIGVSIVRKAAEWRAALRAAHAHDPEALVEAYVPGREVTVSVVEEEHGVLALPAIEIVVSNGFYDYAAKYEKGRSRYLCPAPLGTTLTRQVKELAVRTYRVVGCAGAARVDFRVTPRGRPSVLEINTVPGMTETSLLPLAAAKAGLTYDALAESILHSALRRQQAQEVGPWTA
ncbi:MAG: D-alanine--D-alanine ligase family protein [Nitrospirales bacterium]